MFHIRRSFVINKPKLRKITAEVGGLPASASTEEKDYCYRDPAQHKDMNDPARHGHQPVPALLCTRADDPSN
jgi:hypothetical protein